MLSPIHAGNEQRIKSAICVVVLHCLLGWLFITGLGFEIAARVDDGLKLFDVPEAKLPPPIAEQAADASTKAEEGAASAPNLEAKPSPIVRPPPEVKLEVPPPVVAAPVAGPGNAPSAGASNVPGPGSGSGGIGTGSGSGGSGIGSGGGIARRAWLVRGGFDASDYPRAARRARAEGTVSVRFAVRPDGRVSDCTITRSSGNADLDGTTCRLIERRFRYEPARDARGRPVPDVMVGTQQWWIEPGRY